jgi:hypothetical protein
MHGRIYDDYRVGIQEAIKSDPRAFFGYMDLKKKHVVGHPSAMHFKGRLASGPNDICNIFADFIPRTNADVWVPSDPGPDLIQDDPPFGALQFTVDEVQNVLLRLDVSKSAGCDDPYSEELCIRFCTSTFSFL